MADIAQERRDLAVNLRDVLYTESHDPEAAHAKADDLMVSTLRRLGFDEAMDTYLLIEKWYA